jgi:microcystin-dependent protein
MDPFLGEIRPAGFVYAPTGWALCQGQLLSISQNTALFSLIGTYFGGNGTTTFALPDLRSRVPIGQDTAGQYSLGETGGSENVGLDITQLASHQHTTYVSNQTADTPDPVDMLPAAADKTLYNPASKGEVMAGSITGLAGGAQAHANIQPYLTINYIIALEGIFPQRP